MSNSIKERPLDPIFAELQSMGAKPNGPLWEWIRDAVQSTDKTITKKGEIQSKANVTGRTEQLSATLQNVTASGQLNSLLNVVADRNTDNISDGTGSPLTGGKRGFVALDSNNRLAGTFRNNPANVLAVSTSSTALSNGGVSTAIAVAATSFQFGDGLISYNSGSVDPGSFGTFYIYASDPTFSGGAVSYQFSTAPQNTATANGLIYFGKITTVNGVAKTGGGNSGGTTSGGSGGNRGL